MPTVADIPFPLIDPILLDFGAVKVRWYGVCYIIAFVLAGLVLRGLAKRRRWPVDPQKVVDVLFWGILGVFVGGRIGYFLFYGLSLGYEWWQIVEVWKGGMSFHGGLLGVIVAYWIYCKKTGAARGEFFDGLSLAAAPGIAAVRAGNFINAELVGREWDGAWSMRFPRYHDRPFGSIEAWQEASAKGAPHDVLYDVPRHPSQLYEMFAEGILLYFILRFLMLRLGWGGGRISAAFLVLYGSMRFLVENFRKPDEGIGFQLGTWLTRGQLLCVVMIAVGIIVWLMSKPYTPPTAAEVAAADAAAQKAAANAAASAKGAAE